MLKVEYACFVNNTGFGHAALGYLHVLRSCGHRVRVRSMHPIINQSWMSHEDTQALQHDFSGIAQVGIWHSIPPRWNGLSQGSEMTVGICTFECENPPADWIRTINSKCSNIWYPSKFCKSVFEKAGVEKSSSVIYHMVGEPYFHASPKGYDGGDFVILSVGAWKTRKNWSSLILGCSIAMSTGHPVRLVIKTDRPHAARAEVVRIVPESLRKHFMIVEGELTEKSMAGLYSSCHAFLCASRGEGFCLPVAQAMAAGVPILSTQSGGISDFFDDSCGLVIEPSGLEQVSMDGYPQFSSKYWPVITSESVGRAVVEAVEKYYDIASQKAKNAKKRAEEMFSLPAVRKQMSEALN